MFWELGERDTGLGMEGEWEMLLRLRGGEGHPPHSRVFPSSLSGPRPGACASMPTPTPPLTGSLDVPPLTTINAEGPDAAEAALTTLASAPPASLAALTSLRFAFCDVDGADIEAALSGSGRGLRSLALEGTHRVPDAAAARLVARAGPRLEDLSLFWSLAAHDAVLTAGALCPALTRLNLSGCKAVTDAAVGAVSEGCPGLVSLDVTRCQALSDAGLAAAVGGWRGLTELRCYACEAAGDGLLAALGASCPGLAVLDLCGATGVTDGGVAALAAGCPALSDLGLGWVAGVGDGGVVALADRCRGLTRLSLHGNRLVTGAGLLALAGRRAAGGEGGEGGEGGGGAAATATPPGEPVRPPLPLVALDVMGCVGAPAGWRTREGLKGLFPGVEVFKLQR